VQVAAVKQRLLTTRMQQIILKDGNRVAAPWQFRNCAMGGRHTEKEYPESNISMQESMFMPLSPKTYEDAQEMTVKLQYRLDMFNVSNTPWFGMPTAAIGSPTVGRITSTNGDNRDLQMALKLQF
jgi:hypothetical protein